MRIIFNDHVRQQAAHFLRVLDTKVIAGLKQSMEDAAADQPDAAFRNEPTLFEENDMHDWAPGRNMSEATSRCLEAIRMRDALRQIAAGKSEEYEISPFTCYQKFTDLRSDAYCLAKSGYYPEELGELNLFIESKEISLLMKQARLAHQDYKNSHVQPFALTFPDTFHQPATQLAQVLDKLYVDEKARINAIPVISNTNNNYLYYLNAAASTLLVMGKKGYEFESAQDAGYSLKRLRYAATILAKHGHKELQEFVNQHQAEFNEASGQAQAGAVKELNSAGRTFWRR